jgi:oxygen-independent coproporphyrinogen-3 oxidase
VDPRALSLRAPAGRPGARGPISLYVHVPFCATKCPYCDFNTYSRIESLMPGYVGAVANELRTWATLLGAPEVVTVFFGGGTPSYLPDGDLAGLVETIRRSFDVADDAEITAEANPDDCNRQRLASMRSAGINRLSIGVQALDDDLLRVLGRRHGSAEAVEAFGRARQAGFDNVSIDLMFGLPRQTMPQWTATFERALALGPDHVSMYGLTVEPGTPFAIDVAAGRLSSPDGDLAADMYEYAIDRMAQLGYRHYEISNWALPGRESRHNLAYWRNAAYLGAGPGAHSYLGDCRFADMKSPREYVRRASALAVDSFTGAPPASSWRSAVETMHSVGVVESLEPVDSPLEMAETMMMGLRLDEGIDAELFMRRFGATLEAVYAEPIRELTGLGLLESDGAGLRLTRRGRLLGNEVFGRFMNTQSMNRCS